MAARMNSVLFGVFLTLAIGAFTLCVSAVECTGVSLDPVPNSACDTHCWYNPAKSDCRWSATSLKHWACDSADEACEGRDNCAVSGPDCSCA